MKTIYLLFFITINISICYSQCNDSVRVSSGNMSELPDLRMLQDDVKFQFGKVQKNTLFKLKGLEIKEGVLIDSDITNSIQEQIEMKKTPASIFLLHVAKKDNTVQIKKIRPSIYTSDITIKPEDFEILNIALFNSLPNVYNSETPLVLI